MAARTFVEGIAVCCASRINYSFRVTMCMIAISITATCAGISIESAFLIIMTQRCNDFGAIAVTAFTFVKCVAIFRAGRSNNTYLVIVISDRVIGLGDDRPFCLRRGKSPAETRALIILLHGTFFTGVHIPEAQLYQFSVPALTKILHGRVLAHRPIGLLRPARKFPILDVKSFP